MSHRFSEPAALDESHATQGFSCGVVALDRWITRDALAAQANRSARAFVVTDSDGGNRVVGYHAICAGQLTHRKAILRVADGMPLHPIPVILIARLAVDLGSQGKGLGAWLLTDAVTRALELSSRVGVRAVVVHATDEDAARFYGRFGFEATGKDPLTLQIPLSDVDETCRHTLTSGDEPAPEK